MKKKQMKASLLLVSLLTLGFSVTGCTNDDYDFDQIDATMGFGSGELEIPASSTMNIPLSDILELEEGGSVKIAANGDYLFQLTGSEASSASPMISPIVLRGNSYSNTLTLNASSAAKGTRAAGSHLSFVSPKELMFKYNGTDAAVKSLKSAEVAGEIELKINLTLGGLSSAITNINKVTLTLPGYLEISRVEGNGNGVPMVNGSKITVENVSTSSNLRLTIKAKKLDFEKQDAYGKVVIDNNGSINMDGYFDLGIEANVTRVPTSALTIGANVNVNDITLKSATGIFDPEINISSLGDVTVTGVPDFLSEDGVRADLDNPQIILSIQNDMDAAAKVSAKVISTKNGQNLATVQLPEMNICKTTVAPVTKICICRHKTAELTAQYGAANVYEVSNLATLINQHIPDHVQITDVETRADLSQEMTIEFGHNYNVVPSYEIYAPLAFAEDAVIEYADDFDGWNDDLDDLELSEGTYVRLTADAQNLVPATLIVEATPLGLEGTDISNLIEVNVKKGTVKASADGVTAVNSPLEIELREKVKGALQKLDGLSYKVKGKASHDGTTVTGINLNSEKHTLKLENIKVKLVGKVIGNFN
jgi:nitrogen fixation protein